MSNGFNVDFTEVDGVLGKRCTKCLEWKSLDEFSKDKNCIGGKKPSCRKCRTTYQNDYYNRNKETDLQKKKEYRLKNKDKEHERAKKYRKENAEKIRKYEETRVEWKKAYQKDYIKTYQKLNKDKLATIRQRREARKSGLPDTLEESEILEIKDFFNNQCCLSGLTEDIQMDHVIPVSIGHGGTVKENIIPLTKSLNSSKKDKNIFEWFEANRQRFNLSQEKFDALIDWLAKVNGVSVEDYHNHVYWCHENPYSLEDLQVCDERR